MGLQRFTCHNQGEPQFSNSDDVPPPCPPGLAGTKPGNRLEKEQTMCELLSTTILTRLRAPFAQRIPLCELEMGISFSWCKAAPQQDARQPLGPPAGNPAQLTQL